MADAEGARTGESGDPEPAAAGGGPEVNEGPEALGVAHINEHGKLYFEGSLRCEWTENKGRIIRARRRWSEGDIILAESPLKIVQEHADSAAFQHLSQLIAGEHSGQFDYDALWYWCALQSLTAAQLEGVQHGGWEASSEDTQCKLLLLHTDEITEPSRAAEILVKELVPGVDALVIEKLTQVWVLNCFEYSDDPLGYATYWYSSFMSHSCFPNAVWHYTGTDHVLRARRDIEVGDEVCISYLPEDGLLQAAPMRRMELHESKQFWCTCERCVAGELDHSRGFRCPACWQGKVFARTPAAGYAADGTLLAVQIASTVCDSCSHEVSNTEAQTLKSYESKMRESAESLARQSDSRRAKKLLMDEELLQLEEFIDTNFVQHVQADLVWEQIAHIYVSKRRWADLRRIRQKRCVFHEGAYPGLSGAHAWALEALGDAMMKGAAAVKPEPEKAVALYTDSLRILTLMFGEEHEYVAQVLNKRDAARRA